MTKDEKVDLITDIIMKTMLKELAQTPPVELVKKTKYKPEIIDTSIENVNYFLSVIISTIISTLKYVSYNLYRKLSR